MLAEGFSTTRWLAAWRIGFAPTIRSPRSPASCSNARRGDEVADASGGRPPLRVEYIMATLAGHDVDYVLIGGMAAVVYGSVIPTTDVDLVPDGSRANLGRLAEALQALQAYPVAVPLNAFFFDAFTTATFRTPFGDVDVVLRPDAPGPRRHFTYEELDARANSREVFGMSIRVADLGDVMDSKAAAGRPQDLAALPHLAELREALRADEQRQPDVPEPGTGLDLSF